MRGEREDSYIGLTERARSTAPRIPLMNAGPAEPLGGLDRFVDRPLGRDRLLAGQLVRVQHLGQPDPEDRALERRDPLKRPAAGVVPDQLIQLGLAGLHELAERAGERMCVARQRLLERAVQQVALIQGPDCGTPLLGPTHATRIRPSGCRPAPGRRRR
jgi:hypothetical protein